MECDGTVGGMRMKKETRFTFSIRAKLMGIFVLFGIVVLGATVLYMRVMIDGIYKEHYNENLADIAEMTADYLEAMGIGAEEIHGYAQSRILDRRYTKLLEELQKIRERFELESVYIIYPTGTDEGGTETAVWFADASKADVMQLGMEVENYADDASKRVRLVYESGMRSEDMDWTEVGDGEYVISGYYPIKDTENNSVAIIGVDMSEKYRKWKIDTSLKQVARMIFLIVGISTVLLTAFVQVDIVRAIRRLQWNVQRLGEGESVVQVSENRRDELGEIARAFHRMADRIGRHIGEMEELNDAYRKLIPPGIFDMLHKKSIVEFQLGDQADVNLTVLVMEPEGAGAAMEQMSSKQTFRYINDMLAQTVPAVMEQKGAAWSFDRAGVCSFFNEAAKDALEAALSAGRRLSRQGERVAAGIMKGQVMVGVAGHEARMNVISISEQTRIAEFFLRIGTKYHAAVLIGRSAASQIADFEKHYHVRFLGYLKISASDRLEGVYDVYDGDEDAVRKNKQRTKEDFERGVLLFTQQDYRRARESFIDVLRQYRGDDAAREYLELCSRILEGEEEEGRVWFEKLD